MPGADRTGAMRSGSSPTAASATVSMLWRTATLDVHLWPEHRTAIMDDVCIGGLGFCMVGRLLRDPVNSQCVGLHRDEWSEFRCGGFVSRGSSCVHSSRSKSGLKRVLSIAGKTVRSPSRLRAACHFSLTGVGLIADRWDGLKSGCRIGRDRHGNGGQRGIRRRCRKRRRYR